MFHNSNLLDLKLIFMLSLTNRIVKSFLIIITTLFSAAPSRPEQLNVVITDKNSVTVEWSKPKSDGGSRLRRYIIWRRVEMTDNWVKVTTVEHFITKTVIDKLEFEKNFFFAVSAENDVGESDKAVTREPVRLAKPSGRCSVPWNESKLFFFFGGGHFVKIHKLILIMLYVKYCGNIFICGGQCPWVAKYTVYKMFSFIFVLSRSPDFFVEVFIKCNNLNLVQMCLMPQRAHWLYPTSTRPQPPSPGSQAPPMEDPPSPAMLLRSERAGKPHFPSWRRFPLTN